MNDFIQERPLTVMKMDVLNFLQLSVTLENIYEHTPGSVHICKYYCHMLSSRGIFFLFLLSQLTQFCAILVQLQLNCGKIDFFFPFFM